VSKFFRALEHAERERAQDGAVGPASEATAVVERAEVYGAPTTRDGQAAHASSFSALLEPPPAVDGREVDDHLVSVLDPTSVAAEQYRGIRLAIENHRRERGTRVIAVASPARSDGKTTTAVNLAGALAQAREARVVVVEADLRHPTMARVLGLREGIGLSSYLLDHSIALEDVIDWPRGLSFGVVVAGAPSSMPYELLASARLSALLAALREKFDFVLVDTPPTLPFPDVGILRDLVDGFLLVVRAKRTPREQVHECLNAIGPQRVLGMVFNDDDRTGALASRELPRRRFPRLS
jgi:capsular exopolysaccharide synthesis family protein